MQIFSQKKFTKLFQTNDICPKDRFLLVVTATERLNFEENKDNRKKTTLKTSILNKKTLRVDLHSWSRCEHALQGNGGKKLRTYRSFKSEYAT